ncbi:MAG: DUF488 domain-containing protein [candidate division KSB1 bacterium]|nr:DUF488 domain-containing protein [candidate division KSB1 bacterium]
MQTERVIYSIGHSNRSMDQFLSLLAGFQIQMIADVRRFPTSKKYPHFERNFLQQALQGQGIEYVWLGEFLGGFRNGGYESYLQTSAFADGLRSLTALAEKKITAFLCAEKLFFRCHRRFIADRLVLCGWTVIHILDTDRIYTHQIAERLIFEA